MISEDFFSLPASQTSFMMFFIMCHTSYQWRIGGHTPISITLSSLQKMRLTCVIVALNNIISNKIIHPRKIYLKCGFQTEIKINPAGAKQGSALAGLLFY